MGTFLGVDGGGTKTDFLVIDAAGNVLARHREGCAYYLETGMDALRAMLVRGIETALRLAAVSAGSVDFAFFGLPAYGEDSRMRGHLDAAPGTQLRGGRFRCGNDVVCGWSGALAGKDGINIVAGTGSIGYGEYSGRSARAGGWGELFSDEGSAYWIVREGLHAFARMSDGRDARGPMYELMRVHFGLGEDLDICGAVYGAGQAERSRIAQFAPLIAEAAERGDRSARNIFAAAVRELAAIVDAVHDRLEVRQDESITVSYSGGMFKFEALLLAPLKEILMNGSRQYEFAAPVLPPDAGAAIYAARLNETPLSDAAITALRRQLRIDVA